MITVNGVEILNGTILLGLTGAWTTLNLVLNTGDLSGFQDGASVAITDDSGLTFNGTVIPGRSGLFIDTLHVDIVGGKNGMSKTPTPKQFNNSFLRDIIKSLTADSGETVSSTVDQGLLGTFVGTWTVFADTVASALEQILEFINPNMNWRILVDGTLWFGVETYPAFTQNDADIMEQLPSQQMTKLGIASLSIPVGVTLSNAVQTIGTVSQIQYQIEPAGKLRAIVWNTIQQNERSIMAAVRDYVVRYTDNIKRFSSVYLGNVVSQTADWTQVDIQATDNTVPSMSGIKLLSGQYESVVGMQVLYGWFGGNPSKPFAISFVNNSAAEALAKASAVSSNLTAISSAFNAHFHLVSGTQTGAPDGYSYTPSTVATTKVKGS